MISLDWLARKIGNTDPNDPDKAMWAICDRIAEVQALLHDHIEGKRQTHFEVIAKANEIFSEPELLKAMHEVGYFASNTPLASDE